MDAVVLGGFMNIEINEFVQFGHAKHFIRHIPFRISSKPYIRVVSKFTE